MVKQYKKYGVTTDGYRGDRAILKERVIEGFQEASFTNSVLQLDASSVQTIHLSVNNTSAGYYILLPNAQTLWNNWKITIINDSNADVPIYYYTNNLDNLSLFKKVTSGNMITCLLLDDTTEAGTWTTFRTSEQSNAYALSKYTSNVLDTIEVTWNQLRQTDSDESDTNNTIKVSLGEVLAGTAIRSIYIKTIEQFTFTDDSDSDTSNSLSVTIGTNEDEDHFLGQYTLTDAVADNNFSKDYFEEILSTTDNKQIYAYFTGSNLSQLNAGKVHIVVEKAKEIDPTTLVNPIVQTQIPIGVIMSYAFSDLPEGYWRLDGSLFLNAASSIPQFVQKLEKINNTLPGEKLIVTESVWQNTYNTYGACGKFSWVGGALRFPCVTNFIQGLNNLTDLAKLIPATSAVPEHYHLFGYEHVDNYGWFISTRNEGPYITANIPSNNGTRQWNGSGNGGDYRGDATSATGDLITSLPVSNVSSQKVQPQSIKFPYIISVYSKIQNASNLVLDEIIEDSVNKANITLNNLNNIDFDALNLSGIRVVKETYRNGSSWYRVWNDGWCEQGFTVNVAGAVNTNVSFIKNFTSVPLTVQTQQIGFYALQQANSGIGDITTSGFIYYNGTTTAVDVMVRAEGFVN